MLRAAKDTCGMTHLASLLIVRVVCIFKKTFLYNDTFFHYHSVFSDPKNMA